MISMSWKRTYGQILALLLRGLSRDCHNASITALPPDDNSLPLTLLSF
jgi:hypothetical protein